MRFFAAGAVRLGLARSVRLCAAAALLSAIATPAVAQDGAGETADFNPDRNVYFGDTHIHTRNSFDAYIFNVRKTPDAAYRWAKGETVQHPAGFDMTIAGGPLDFYMVTDHAEYLGILRAMDTPGSDLSRVSRAQDMFSSDPVAITTAFQSVGASVRTGQKLDDIYNQELSDSVWAETVAAADRHNEPGVFTTFAAYEYTAVTTVADDGTFGGGNLHRNVFFADKAPARLFSTLDSTNPEDLWDWMDEQRALGFDAIAAPHNSNVSNGEMFKTETFGGEPLNAAYAEQRMRNEPLVEVTQVKGTSETHPSLSPNDEFADFEIYEALLGVYTVSEVNGGYVRQAYQLGLGLENEQGFNPYKFGLIAASDSHVVAGAYTEKDYWSKVGVVDGLPELRGSAPLGPSKDWSDEPTEGIPGQISNNAKNWFSRWSASGLTGVWAEENTRAALFAAFRRKETFATTGPRIRLRFFAGGDFDEALLDDPALVSKAYAGGATMGGDLVLDADAAPGFVVWAQGDPGSAPLQRLQVVKVTAEGERVYDVACAAGAPDAEHRCPDNGASVDLSTCEALGDGAAELKTLWRDPDRNPAERAAYYVRALENPTCRWSTWEALRNGTPPRPNRPLTLQERAYSSPIWVSPAG
ncbi:MAG: DUF3604 domain-containing protein [Pseudomonadota bacterium]